MNLWKSHDLATRRSDYGKILCGLLSHVYRCKPWTLRKGDENQIMAFGMKGLREILCVAWMKKKSNDWVLEKSGANMELLNIIQQ